MIGELVPIFGMITGLLITLAGIFGFVRFTQGPVGQAFARRIQGHAGSDPETSAEVAQLREDVDQLRRQVEETQERVDFAERLLSQQRPAARLPEAGA
jgi:ubiquinone biosynthesis protein UbiJ